MKLVKKTAQYSIYQRGDNRYAVTDARKKPINGEEKTRILLEEELVKATRPAQPAADATAGSADTPADDSAE